MTSLKTRSQTSLEDTGSKVFLLSGIEDAERQSLSNDIKELGAVYLESEAFKPQCTHIICGKITRSEKFLGACATGKWVLHPVYIKASAEKKEWQTEEDYEWVNYSTPDIGQMVQAARRWRFHNEVYQTKAFSGWKTAVVVPGNKKASIYKRLLISGGADVYQLKLPVKNPGKVMNLLTFVFVSEKLATDVLNLMDYGILCLKPEYIGDYLVKDPPPDPLDYLVQAKTPAANTSLPDIDTSVICSQGPLDCSQGDIICSQGDNACSQDTCLYAGDSTPSSRCNSNTNSPSGTPAESPKKSRSRRECSSASKISPLVVADQVVLTRRRTRNSLISSLSTSEANVSDLGPVPEKSTPDPLSSSTLNVERVKVKISEISQRSDLKDNREGELSNVGGLSAHSVTGPVGWRPAVFRGGLISTSSGQKRKLDDDENDEINHQYKKIKSDIQFLNNVAHVQFSNPLNNMINQCFEEEGGSNEFLHGGLDMVISSLSNKSYPSSSILHSIMTKILQRETCPLLVQKAYNVLMRVLQAHPPTQSTLIGVYMDSFLDHQTIGDTVFEQKERWQFVRQVIEQVVSPYMEADQQGSYLKGHLLLLQYLVTMLEENFQCNWSRLADERSRVKFRSAMICQLLWPDVTQTSLNKRCQQLIILYWDALVSSMEVDTKMTVVKCMTSLVSMACGACHVMEAGPPMSVNSGDLRVGEKTEGFIQEISKAIVRCDLSHTALQQVLLCLQPVVICLHVCCQILSEMDDYLILDGISTANISLCDIVSKYLYLLPKVRHQNHALENTLKSPHSKIRQNHTSVKAIDNTPLVNGRRPTPLKCEHQNRGTVSDTVVKQEPRHKSHSVNKKNFKGETALHIACIKNNVVKVKDLLRTQGIDVNARDNAGWTPLHEACNHGNLECVVELLNFVPAKTIQGYLGTDDIKAHKVDLLACTDELITPLHDAVMNDRADVCRALLQHGGSRLLECRTIQGYTPIDLVTSDEVRDILFSYSSSDQDVIQSCSQESFKSDFSQGSPSDYLYNQVIEDGAIRNYTTREEASKYITLVTTVVRCYLNILDVSSTAQTSVRSTSENTRLNGMNGPVLSGNSPHKPAPLTTKFPSNMESVSKETSWKKLPPVSDQDEHRLRTDLKILRKFRKYVERFERHIEKISHPEDLVWLRCQLVSLYCCAERYADCAQA